jgi:hypothetical protein
VPTAEVIPSLNDKGGAGKQRCRQFIEIDSQFVTGYLVDRDVSRIGGMNGGIGHNERIRSLLLECREDPSVLRLIDRSVRHRSVQRNADSFGRSRNAEP